MRFAIVFLFWTVASAFAAEPTLPQPSTEMESAYVVRTGEQLQAPHVLTYRLVEYAQQRGRWIVPDVGYWDEGGTADQLWFAGGGVEAIHSRHITWTQILYFAQEAGSKARNQHDLLIWPVVDLRFHPRWIGQAVIYPTIPLNQSARWALDVDRVKVEYEVTRKLNVGAGYSATVGANTSWTNKPLLTATLHHRTGDWEMWLERMPGGAQVQLRYQIVRKGY